MPDRLADQLTDLKNRDEEAQETVRQVIEEALADTELISVHSVTQGTTEGSVKVKLNYNNLENMLNNVDELEGIDVSLRNGDVFVNPEGNP